MSFDIYGNYLRSGYCEVHPDHRGDYPCDLCKEEEYYRQQQEEEEYRQQQEEEEYHAQLQEQEAYYLEQEEMKEERL